MHEAEQDVIRDSTKQKMVMQKFRKYAQSYDYFSELSDMLNQKIVQVKNIENTIYDLKEEFKQNLDDAKFKKFNQILEQNLEEASFKKAEPMDPYSVIFKSKFKLYRF